MIKGLDAAALFRLNIIQLSSFTDVGDWGPAASSCSTSTLLTSLELCIQSCVPRSGTSLYSTIVLPHLPSSHSGFNLSQHLLYRLEPYGTVHLPDARRFPLHVASH